MKSLLTLLQEGLLDLGFNLLGLAEVEAVSLPVMGA